MDSKFELTEEEKLVAQEEYSKRAWNEVKVNLDIPLSGWRREECLLRAQVNKVLSHFEPVELEALGDEEIGKLYDDYAKKHGIFPLDKDKFISQATIRKNQKVQLYRLKEG